MATITLSMIARDEEAFIASAIESVKDVVDEIIVVDTGSKDRTPAIARELGAKVLHFDWKDDFSAARNFGLKEVTSDWVLVLDADEEMLRSRRQSLGRWQSLEMTLTCLSRKTLVIRGHLALCLRRERASGAFTRHSYSGCSGQAKA